MEARFGGRVSASCPPLHLPLECLAGAPRVHLYPPTPLSLPLSEKEVAATSFSPLPTHDRSSRPLRSPRQTDQLQEVAICAARRILAWGPHRIGWRLGIARSTVYAVLRRAGLHRLAWLHRTTREVVRYEHARPGDLVHLDIKKLGRIPQGGGKRILPGFGETHSGPQRGPRLGFDFLHVAVDDHSRYAYVEALPDERGATAAAFLVRALAHFKRQDIAVERILTDNGTCYVSRIFTRTAAARNIRVKRTRPFRPQTNGKAEAFNKIMQAEWAYQRPYYSNRERLNALPGFLAYYNHRRPHGGIDGATPASRLSTTSLGTTPSVSAPCRPLFTSATPPPPPAQALAWAASLHLCTYSPPMPRASGPPMEMTTFDLLGPLFSPSSLRDDDRRGFRVGACAAACCAICCSINSCRRSKLGSRARHDWTPVAP